MLYQLNKNRVSIFKVDVTEVEELIKQTYGHFYEIMPYEDVGGDGQVHSVRTCKGEISETEKGKIVDLKSAFCRMYSLNAIMTDLCNRDIIEAGEYLIDVDC